MVSSRFDDRVDFNGKLSPKKPFIITEIALIIFAGVVINFIGSWNQVAERLKNRGHTSKKGVERFIRRGKRGRKSKGKKITEQNLAVTVRYREPVIPPR